MVGSSYLTQLAILAGVRLLQPSLHYLLTLDTHRQMLSNLVVDL